MKIYEYFIRIVFSKNLFLLEQIVLCNEYINIFKKMIMKRKTFNSMYEEIYISENK